MANTQPVPTPTHTPTQPSTTNEDDEFEDDDIPYNEQDHHYHTNIRNYGPAPWERGLRIGSSNQRDEEDEEDNEKDAHWDFYDDEDDDQGLNTPNLTPEEQQRFAKAERKHQKLIKRMEKIDAGIVEDESDSDSDVE